MWKKGIALLASAGMVGGMVMLVGPAGAGTTWSKPQDLSTSFGREVEVSGTGRVAVWIRSNRLVDAGVTGPARASYFINKKKGWSASVAVPGSTESTNVILSKDGNYALFESGDGQSNATGYSIAKRTSAKKWGTPQPLVKGVRLEAGQMSRDARTVVWVDWADPGTSTYPPGELKAITRDDSGTWSAPVTVGKVTTQVAGGYYGGYYGERESTAAALSPDGSTLVWLDENLALTSAVKAADGTWTPAGTIKDYAGTPYVGLRTLALSEAGSTVMWVRQSTDGILTSVRSATGWGTPVMATVDQTTVEAMTPKGTSIAYVTGDGDVLVTMRLPDGWGAKKTVGSVFYGYRAQMTMVNTTLAYGSIGYKAGKPTCAVSTSLLVGGKWAKGTKIASSVCHPAVAYNGRTMVWGNLKTKALQSVKR
jgi:hypothetical protein